jgi:hypothetical protein
VAGANGNQTAPAIPYPHTRQTKEMQMMTWGQIGIAVVELARAKARRHLRAVLRNLLTRLRLSRTNGRNPSTSNP